jgi:hypothetical protein
MIKSKFSKKTLKNYEIIKEPGTHIVQVSNTVKPEYLIEDGSKSRYIINLRVGTIEGFKKCLEIFGDKEEIEIKEINNCFLSGVIWSNNLEDLNLLPVKGENVIASFDYLDDKLVCTSINLIPRKQLDKFELNEMCETRNLFKQLLMKNECNKKY